MKKPKYIVITERQKREQEQLMIEECKEMYDDVLQMAKEWDGTLMDGLDKNERWKELEGSKIAK